MNRDKAGRWLLPLLDPVIVVVCLFAAQWACGRPLTPAIAYLALLAFIISIPVFVLNLPQAGPPRSAWPTPSGGSPRPESPGRQTPFGRRLAAFNEILVRWMGIVAALLFIAFAFKVGAMFSRSVMLTWFVVTPIALCLVHVISPLPSSPYVAEAKKENERPTVERSMFSDKWENIRWIVWGLFGLVGTVLLLVWLGVISPPPPPSPPTVYSTVSGKEPLHRRGRIGDGHGATAGWVLTVVRDGRQDLRMGNFVTQEGCEQNLKEMQSRDPAITSGKCSGPNSDP